MDKIVFPELVLGILDEFDEGDEQSPWVWTIDDQSFQEDACDLFLN